MPAKFLGGRRAYRERNRSRLRSEWREWDEGNPGWRSLLRTLRKRGLTLDQYHAMNEAQDFLCAICGGEGTPGLNRLAVDHDHATGKVRGLLCQSCNRGIGLLGDSATNCGRAQQYLKRAA